MEINKNWLAPCGLYCGVCGVMMATRDGNDKFKERLATVYGIKPEQVKCAGCQAPEEEVFGYCRLCPIKSCNQERGYQGCHQCDDHPCEHVDNFAMPVGKKVMLRAIPQWREWGTEKYVEQEHKRYLCPECGYELFRGAKRCRGCKAPVDVD